MESCRMPHFPIESEKSLFKIIKSFRNLKYCWNKWNYRGWCSGCLYFLQDLLQSGSKLSQLSWFPWFSWLLLLLSSWALYIKGWRKLQVVFVCVCLCVADLAGSCGDVESFSLKSDDTYWYWLSGTMAMCRAAVTTERDHEDMGNELLMLG